jgi:hypothetical protein
MKKKKLSILLLFTMVLGVSSVNAFKDKDDCTPNWAPFWQTSCSYTAEDENGELVRYQKTCSHFIFTTKCFVTPLYDL